MQGLRGLEEAPCLNGEDDGLGAAAGHGAHHSLVPAPHQVGRPANHLAHARPEEGQHPGQGEFQDIPWSTSPPQAIQK